jgi:hypothetical protein
VLGRSNEYIMVSEGGSRATKMAAIAGGRFRAAASEAVMRAGRHYAQFTVVKLLEGGHNAHGEDGHCLYGTYTGRHFPAPHNWEGIQGAIEGDRIGMLLDLDQGSMTVYKNDERLGVMATGLSGEYSWAVELYSPDESAHIDTAPSPASPTAEELARAVVFRAEQLAAHEAEHADDDY